MTNDHFAEIRDHFLAALECDGLEAQLQYAAEHCAHSPDLRVKLEDMLRAHNQSEGFLASRADATQGMPAIPEATGTQIGPYKLLQQIGQGGMGVVWMAEQTQPVQRKVALKVIKPGMDSRQVIARFEAERQALAMMDHVNIARVLDAGTTESGLPYFVMELVHGVPVTKYCDDNHLTPRERLELFVPVCQAIQHAHQKGIIHRDIKPSNVMVTLYDGKPVPKVIDFGVAKATEQSLTERTLFTQYGTLVGTLEYMSPEQAEMSALGVDTRSDIFSLGVLLYELLTGSTPLTHKRLKEAAYAEVLRIIKEEEAPKPSTRLSESGEALASISAQRQTEPAKLSKLMRGELDWIVMKTLEKDRNRRYETASGFAADVERYLSDEPVQACPPSAAYRLRKLYRRNRGMVVAASFILLSLIAGIIGTTWGLIRAEAGRQEAVQAQRAEGERAEGERQAKRQALAAAAAEKKAKIKAEANAAIAQATLNFVESKVFAAARPKDEEGGLGHDVTLRQAIEAALPFVEKGFPNEPLVEARMRETLGTSFLYLGQAQIAAEQFQAARTLHTKYLGPNDPATLTSMHDLAISYSNLGRFAEAFKLHEETLALRKAKLGPYHPDTLRSMGSLANSYDDLGRLAEALKLQEETLALRKAKLGPDDPDTLSSMHNLANSYHALGRYDEALKLEEETLTLQKAKLGPDHPDTLISMQNLAVSYQTLGRRADALKLEEETLALRKAKLGLDHPDTLSSMQNLAASYSALGRRAEALKLEEETLVLRKANLGPDHPDTLSSMQNLAVSYYDLGRRAEALKLNEQTLTLRKAKLGPDHPATFTSMNNLANSYADLGRHAEALKLREETLALRKAKLGPDHPDTLISMENLAVSYKTLGRRAEALKLREETLALMKAKLGPDHPDTLTSMNNLANSYHALGRYDEALKLREETLTLQKATLGPDHPDTLRSMHNLARSYHALGRHIEALKLREETFAFMKAKHGPDHSDTLMSMGAVAQSLEKLDRDAEAMPIIDEILQRAAGKVVDSQLMAGVMEVRQRHFAKSKDAAGCRSTAEMWEKLQCTDPESLYNAACFRAVTAAVIQEDPKTPGADAPRLAKEEADRAMAWLKQAVAAGYENGGHMKTDTDLDVLRNRPDFQELAAQLAAGPEQDEK